MADTAISGLPSAGALAGTEPVPLVQGGATVKATVATIAPVRTVAGRTGAVTLAVADVSGAVAKAGDTMTGRLGLLSYAETYAAPTISAGALALDMSAGGLFAVSLNANITTFTIANVPATSGVAQTIALKFTADGTARSVTWPASVKWPAGTAPTLTSTSTKQDLFVLTTFDAGTSWLGLVSGQNF